MSSLACKCVFYSPEHNAKGDAHILMTITLGAKMITGYMIPFFSSTLWALSVGIF